MRSPCIFFSECQSDVFGGGRGMCKSHYDKMRVRGRLEEFPVRPVKRCSIVGCNRTSKCRGWCASHYQNWRRSGSPLTRFERGELEPDTCPICRRADRVDVELAIIEHGAGRKTSEMFGASLASLGRHRDHADLPSHRFSRCPVCSHPEVNRLDDLLKSGVRGSIKEVGEIVGLSSARYHAKNHLDNPEYAAEVARFQLHRLEAIKRVLRTS